jgi:hypothetical protein
MSEQDEDRIASTPWEVGSAGISEAERRRYFRIKDHIALKYRILSEQEYADAVGSVPESRSGLMGLANTFAATTRQMAPSARRIRELHPELCRYLAMVNEKLDMLARAFAVAESDMASWPTQRVCLSAGGIAFDVQAPLLVGARLKVTLVLYPSLVHIVALASVMRCRPSCSGEAKQHVAIQFTEITEEDRELLIQHIVQRESRRLRARRVDTEQARGISLSSGQSQE